MIQKVSSVSEKRYTPQQGINTPKNPTFGMGLVDIPIWFVQQCEKQPMVNVSFLDLSTAIVPRTIIETKESNAHAGFEAFRRESSGLIVNCLIPSFIVMGAAKLLQKPIMGNFGKADLSNVWANEESLKIVEKYLSQAEGKGSIRLEKALNAFMDDLSGVDGDVLKAFITPNTPNSNIRSGIKQIAKSSRMKNSSKLFDKGYDRIIKSSHMAEHLKLKGSDKYLTKDLKGILSDFVEISKAVEKEGIKTSEELSKYISKSVKLVNWKSIAGLGVIIPLAASMQPINRWITRKTSGQKGAPIYKDFGQNAQHKEMTPQDKRELLAQKFVSISSMIGVCALSMFMERPVLKNIFQFKGLFPTMDQARIISTATFASRMAVAEDKNELREATVRDIATFSSFYFLGDYVAKGIATVLQKRNKGVKLINTLKPLKENANGFEKFWHWAKHTSLKSSDELVTHTDKKLRTLCQIGNIAFSLLALGVFIPLYTRSKTNQKRAEELAALNAEKQSSPKSDSSEFANSIIKDSTTFQSFMNRRNNENSTYNTPTK